MELWTDAGMDGSGTFLNTGTFRKRGGSTVQNLFFGSLMYLPRIINTGTIDVQVGTFALGGDPGARATNSGTITAAVGTTLWLTRVVDGSGTIDADYVRFHVADATITGSFRANRTELRNNDSTVRLSGTILGLGDVVIGASLADGFSGGGTLDLTGATFAPGATTLDRLTVVSGHPSITAQLITDDDLSVAGALSWNFGTLRGVAGTGSLTVLSDMTLNGTYTVRDFNLINAGDAIWTGGSVTFYGASRFTNLAGATFDDRIDGNFGGIDTCPVFDNRGLFRKSGGDGTTLLRMQLANSGSVVIERGSLNIHCGYVQVVGDGGSAGTISGSFTGTSSIQNVGTLTAAPTPTPPPPVTNYTQTATGRLTVAIGGLTPGTGYGQIAVTGNVSLAGTLSVVLTNGFSPQLLNTFRIIDNRGTNPIAGAFSGLPEGGTVQLGSIVFQISYQGGTGNDVVLTVVSVNTPPTANAGGPYTVAEGSSIALNGSGSSDPDQPTNTLTYQWDFDNDGQFDDAVGVNPSFSAAGLDGYPGAAVPVRLRVTDSAGTTDVSNATVSISNANPIPAITSISAVRVEGTPISVTGSASDPAGSNDTLTYAWAVFKDGSATAFATGGNSTSFNFTPTDNGSYRIVLTVSDEDGGSASIDQMIAVANVAPTPSIVSIGNVRQEGTPITVVGSASDPAGSNDTLTYAWAVFKDGSATEFATGGNTTSFNFTPTDNGSYRIVLTVSDEDGGAASIDQTIAVTNVAPTTGSVAGPLDPVAVNGTVNVSGGFTDPGTADTHTATWDWGDGTTSAGTVAETNGSGTVTGSHVYTSAGVYTVILTVTDDDGGSSSATFQYVVVYDPSAGFVTGGGWINSPAGAYAPDPSLTGKAHFGFISKYQQGAAAPDGNTQFQFQTANFSFRSTSYDWMVVAGSRAKFKGSGAVNGSGDYGFMLTATDLQLSGGGGVDKLRIKIWDKTTGVVIYDNQMGAGEDAAPVTTLGGGSIQVHSGGSPLMAASQPVSATSTESLTMGEVKPILAEALRRWQAAGVETSSLGNIRIRIADLPGAMVGMVSGNTIWLDDSAAGWGWFVDTTPSDDSEFTTSGDQGEQGRIDLLTVLMHEIGHLLGADHHEGGVMAELLNQGERRAPASDVDSVAANMGLFSIDVSETATWQSRFEAKWRRPG